MATAVSYPGVYIQEVASGWGIMWNACFPSMWASGNLIS